MAKEDLDELGFKKLTEQEEASRYTAMKKSNVAKESTGFVAGTNVAPGIMPASKGISWWPFN